MDRQIVYPGAIPLESDVLKPQRFALKGLGALADAILGDGPYVDGLDCIPTTPASLAVQILPGSLYELGTVDVAGFGSLGADSEQTVKQALLAVTSSITLTPPGTSGYAQNYLIQAAYLDEDISPEVLAYYNAANPDAPWLGPNNSGDAQPTVRRGRIVISAKAGTAATAGTQTTPAPDPGYVGLYAVVVANGATTLDASTITKLTDAPFIDPKLPAVPKAAQTGKWNYAVAGGSANALTATLVPAPDAYSAGFHVRLKIASNNTGSATLDVNGLGAKTIKRPDGSNLASGNMVAGSVVELVYDGTNWFLQTAQATNTNTSSGGLTTVAVADPITGDGTSGNPIDIQNGSKTLNGAWRGATKAEFDAGNASVVVTPDLLVGMTADSPIVNNFKNVIGLGGIEVIDRTITGDPASCDFDIDAYALFVVSFGKVNWTGAGGSYYPSVGYAFSGGSGIQYVPNAVPVPGGPDGSFPIFHRAPKGSLYGDNVWSTLPHPDTGAIALAFGAGMTKFGIRWAVNQRPTIGVMRLIGVRKLL